MTHPSVLDRAASAEQTDLRQTARFTASRLWPWVPALLLTTLIGVQMTVLASVLDDPTFATEPDYYRKAVDWDARMARERQSQALGWTARARAEARSPNVSQLTVRLVDAQGMAVSGARVHASAFHNARSAHARELMLVEVSPGVYGADLGSSRPGVWELRLAAQRGPDSYETTLRFELERARSSP
jgi:nitrogen fixation protein FixH